MGRRFPDQASTEEGALVVGFGVLWGVMYGKWMDEWMLTMMNGGDGW